jgi:N-acetylglucosaminyl-diphospho-decaprenol L-rhamnosyltransferase
VLPTIVIATRNRRRRLIATLARLDPAAPVVVVDNRSEDGTAAAVRAAHPRVRVIELDRDLGSAARTVGVAAAKTPLVAFCDDDSWWAPGALSRAAELFDAHPRLGLLAARIVVEPDGTLDPTCRAMRQSPLEDEGDLPGPPVLGFLACGAVARRDAVLRSGGFHERFGIGGEEELLAIDLRAAGWGLAYADDVVAHHHPSPAGASRGGRARVQHRNALWSAWLRRPPAVAVRATARTALVSPRAAGDALTGLPWALRERRVVPAPVEGELRALDRAR